MAKNTKISIIALTSLVLISSYSHAEELYQGPWYVLPGISYNVNDNSVDAKDNVSGSIRVGKEFNKDFDFQVGASYASAGSYKQSLIGVDALYFFSRDNLRPYILAGIGYAQNKTNLNSISSTKDSFMADAGIGLQYLVSESVGFQLGVRGIFSQAGIADSSGDIKTKTVSTTEFGFGGIYRFDAEKSKPAITQAAPVKISEIAERNTQPEELPSKTIAEKQEKPIANPEAKIQAKQPKEVEIEDACRPTIESINLKDEMLFEYKKTNILSSSNETLDRFISKIKNYDNVEVMIVAGHTDRIGSESYNIKLSEKRAVSVKSYLIAHGITNTRISTAAKGESEPIVACASIFDNLNKENLIKCLAPNRRVVIEAKGSRTKACGEKL